MNFYFSTQQIQEHLASVMEQTHTNRVDLPRQTVDLMVIIDSYKRGEKPNLDKASAGKLRAILSSSEISGREQYF